MSSFGEVGDSFEGRALGWGCPEVEGCLVAGVGLGGGEVGGLPALGVAVGGVGGDEVRV